MGLQVLQLIKGDPHGKDKSEQYAFTPDLITGDAETALRDELACWALICDREEIRDHDDYGKDSWSTLHRITPFLEADGDIILWQGKLTAFRHGDAIFFLPNGNYVGSTQRTIWSESSSRQDNYEIEEFSICKISPSAVMAYYDAVEENPYHTVFAIDKKAEHIEFHPDTKVILAPNAEIQYRPNILARECHTQLAMVSVAIPAGVEKIQPGVFLGCRNLKHISVDAANPHFHAAGNCLIATNTKTLVAGCATSVIPNDGSVEIIARDAFSFSGIRHVILPEGVKKLDSHAFLCSGLDSIVVPKSLESLGYDVFTYCYGFRVYYGGTPQDFEKITYAAYDAAFRKATRYYYAEHKPQEEGNFWHYGENGEVLVWA